MITVEHHVSELHMVQSSVDTYIQLHTEQAKYNKAVQNVVIRTNCSVLLRIIVK